MEAIRPIAPRRRRWVSILISLVLLGSGAILGAGVTVLVIVRQVQYRIHHPEQFPRLMANRMSRRLDLNADQHTQVERILREHQRALMTLRQQMQPRLEAELDAIRSDIAGVLNANQREEFEDWLSRLRRNWIPQIPNSQPEDTAPFK